MHIDLTQPFNGKPKTRPGVIRPDAPVRFDPTALTPTPPTQNPNPNPAPEPAPETIQTTPAPMTAIAQPTPPTPTAATPTAPAPAGNVYTLDLVREKDCKHSVRFCSTSDLAVLDTAYLNRIAPETATARGVRVTLQFIP